MEALFQDQSGPGKSQPNKSSLKTVTMDDYCGVTLLILTHTIYGRSYSLICCLV